MEAELQEGDYCPECDMRQAAGHSSHMPRCSKKTPETEFIAKPKPIQKETTIYEVYAIFLRDKKVFTSDLVAELLTKGINRKAAYQAISYLKRRKLITQPLVPGGAGFWELEDASDNIQV